jgi:predicted ATP-grasp superfamily ATP-dependent carboligase
MSRNGRRGWVAAIGAGKEQVPSINCAQAEGWSVIALDGNPDAPGMAISDLSLVVDLTDEDECARVLEANAVKFVVPAPVGKILRTVGAVNDSLGLPGISRQAALLSTDKRKFDRAVRVGGARRPRQIVLDPGTDLVAAADIIGFPLIIKPSEGAGSRGIHVCEGPEDLTKCEGLYDSEGVILCEQFVVGAEVGVDAAVIDGEVKLVLVREKTMTSLPFRQEVAYSAPAARIPEEVVEQIQLCVDALGLDRCLLHADVILGPDGPFVVEMAGRPAGLLLSSQLVPLCTGVDYLGLGLLLLNNIGSAAEMLADSNPQRCGHMAFIQTRAGNVTRVPDPASLMLQPGIGFAEVWAQPGDVLGPVQTAADILARGVILGYAGDVGTARAATIEALAKVGTIEIASGAEHA